jgi:hypothetical protein
MEPFSATFELCLKALLSICRLAADWPETMQIVRLIAQEHMNNKFVSKPILSCQPVAYLHYHIFL